MRRLLLILALLLPVALLWTLLRAAAAEPAAAPPPAPRPTDTTWPSAVPAAVATPMARTTIPPTTAIPGTLTIPEPFVQNFAEQPTVSPLPRLPSPTVPLSMPPNVDGCDRSYGTRSQCVPWQFPPGTADACTWLRDRGFLDSPLTARAPDRHHLDPDTDGFACAE